MAHAVMLENADPATRQEMDAQLEPMGHKIRANLDANYKRATWGLRPEDVEAVQALTGNLTGPR